MKTCTGKNTLDILNLKLLKILGSCIRQKPHVDKHLVLSLYRYYIHSYIDYRNIAWGSTTRTNLKKYAVNRTCYPSSI